MQLLYSIIHTIKELSVFISKHLEDIIFTGFAYFLIAGICYMTFYVWKNKRYWHFKIQQLHPDVKHIIRDLKYSVSTAVIFGVVTIGVLWASKHGYTLIYTPINKYGYTWFFISIVIMVIIHDTYFYWTHRFLHWKPIFRRVHKAHHLSHNPTPFSAYAFHPAEALVNVGIVPLIAFTIPSHIAAITIFTTYQLLINVFGHLGFELLPKGFARHKVTKWHNTFTHHNMHHKFVKYNYGLYFNFWDRVMKTNHPHYEVHFDKVVDQSRESKTVIKDTAKHAGQKKIIKASLQPVELNAFDE